MFRENESNTNLNPDDLNRKRHISEGDVKPILAKKSDLGRLNYKRYQIHDEGHHERDGQTLHLKNRFVNNLNIRREDLRKKIKASLQDVSPELTPGQTKSTSTKLFW